MNTVTILAFILIYYGKGTMAVQFADRASCEYAKGLIREELIDKGWQKPGPEISYGWAICVPYNKQVLTR